MIRLRLFCCCLIFFISAPYYSFSQTVVTGKVFDKTTNEFLTGAVIQEKGTNNATSAGVDGSFKITVSNTDAVLVVSFITYITQEYELNGKTNIIAKLKSHCVIDFFDNKLLTPRIQSGVLHTPVGGSIEYSRFISPIPGTFRLNVGLQSDLKNNNVFFSQLDLNHFIWDCDYIVDAGINYRQIEFKDNFNSKAYGIEGRFKGPILSRWTFIACYHQLKIKTPVNTRDLKAPSFGLATTIDPLWVAIEGKAVFYNNNTECQLSLNKGFRNRLRAAINYYKLNSFDEITLSLGYEFYYPKRKRKLSSN